MTDKHLYCNIISQLEIISLQIVTPFSGEFGFGGDYFGGENIKVIKNFLTEVEQINEGIVEAIKLVKRCPFKFGKKHLAFLCSQQSELLSLSFGTPRTLISKHQD